MVALPSKSERAHQMTVGASLVVILVGLLIAAFLSSMIGMIVAGVGVVGLILALVSGDRTRSTL
jgi:hypothetical protein